MNKTQLHHVKVALDSVNKLSDTIEYLEKENIKLRKALNKACMKFAFVSNEKIIEELGSFTLGEINRSEEKWKEWLLEDE